MRNSKLVRTLATLSKDEWSSLRKYILMTSSETSEIFSLFTLLYKRKEKLKSNFEIAKIGSKYFSKLTDKGFGNLQSRVNLIVEEWLAINQFQSEKHAQNLALVRALNSRGLYKEADQIANKIEKNIAKNDGLDTEDSKILQKLYHAQYYSDNPIKYRDKNNLINNLIDNHTKSYKYQSQLYICELYNWGALNKIDFEEQINLLRSSIDRVDGGGLSNHLDSLEKMISSLDYDAFHNLKTSLVNSLYSQDTELQTLVTMYLIAYSLRLYMSGTLSDSKILLQLNEYGLESGVLMKSGKIPQPRFFNLISTLGNIKSYDWTQIFINKWINKVETTNKSSTLALANAYNSFYHSDFAMIRSLLNNVEFDYLKQKIRSLGLLMIALYKDESNNDLLINHIENYKRTLKRNRSKISVVFFKSHFSLIKVIEFLIVKDFGDIKLDPSSLQYLTFRNWCLSELKLK